MAITNTHANPTSPNAGNDWSREYDDFMRVGGRCCETGLSKRRIHQGVSFIKDVGAAEIATKIKFLRSKDLASQEIEQVLEEVFGADQPHVCLAYISGDYTDKTSEEAEDVADTHLEEDPFLKLWRTGQMVYAYGSDFMYYPVPVLDVDPTRGGDHIQVKLPDADQPVWLAEGLKGAVADVFPQKEHLSFNTSVIAFADNSHDSYEEATVISVVDARAEAVIEFSRTGEVVTCPLSQLRVTTHPKLLEHYKHQEEINANNVRTKLYVSQALFDVPHGQKDRPFQEEQAEAEALTFSAEVRQELASECLSHDERYHLTSYTRGYRRYSPLNVGVKVSFIRTFSDFVREYGETPYGSNEHVIPEHPTCQQMQTGIGFGVNLSRHERHKGCRLLYRYNPILDVASQCFASDSMFVDPDFPPSRHSLYGSAMGKNVGDDEFEWTRISSILNYACMTGTDSSRLAPGPFTNLWMPHLISCLPETSECEDSFSPSDACDYYGCYTVRVFVDSTWHYVLIDDFIPVHKSSGAVAVLRSKNKTEIYATLVEKALAKLEGSYAGLKLPKMRRNPSRVWEMLTGGVAETSHYSLLSDRSSWVENLEGRSEQTPHACFMFSRAYGEDIKLHLRGLVTERDFAKSGLQMGAYSSVLCVKHFEVKGKDVSVVLVRNPFSPTPQPGKLFQSTDYPEEVIEKMREIQLNHPEGTWMTFYDYMRFHEQLLTCWHFSNYQKCVVYGSFENHCGGSLFSHEETFFNNNQYYLNLTHSSYVAVQLSLMDRRYVGSAKPDGVRLQLHLFRAGEAGAPLPKGSRDMQMFTSNMCDLEDDEQGVEQPSVHFICHLQSGGCVIIPDIGTTCSSEAFVLKIWSNSHFNIRLVNT